MKKSFIISLLLIFCLSIFGQEKEDEKKNYFSTVPNFYLDVLNYKSNEQGKTKVEVFVQVPYSSIQFTKADDKFTANYSVNLTFYDKERDEIIQNNLFEEKVTAANFNQTTSPRNFNLSLRTFQLEPDDYVLKCIVEDSDSKRSVTSEHEIEVLAIDDDVELSDILLVSEIIETASGNRLVPNVSQSVESMDQIIKFYYEAYVNEDKQTKIIYSIKDKNENQSYAHTIDKKLTAGKNEIYGSLKYPSFTFGEYELIVRIEDSTGTLLSGIGKSFHAKIMGLPRSITDLEKAIDQLTYIAESSELSTIEDNDSFEDKLNAFLNFWEEKDPTPNTKINEAMLEYYRRVEYANKNFEAYKNEGWRTDMGMVYVSLGPPDYVDRHPFAIDSKPYEVWDYYSINRRFVFVDYTGFGDYRLVNRDYRDINRYRY